ncbi:MAG: 50S ribosomal protein L24 [Oscillospiraceae bacterium]|jgi:large subunit ribosomal protein L24|nr:50S ribosomal protein L24 [Oscillospiraceae bacterium]
MNKKVHVRSGDTVTVLSGRDAGKRGRVVAVSPKEGKVIVEKVNLVSKHIKPRKAVQEGGIVKAEGALYSSKVQIVCPGCDKSTRIGHEFDEQGKKRRICKKCGAGL